MYPVFHTSMRLTTWQTFLRSSIRLRPLSLSIGVASRPSHAGSNCSVRKLFPVLRDPFMCASCSRRLISRQGTSAVSRRMTHSRSQSSRPSSSRSNLLLYGFVAFLWERERISNDEILRCVHQYEERQHRLHSSISPQKTLSDSQRADDVSNASTTLTEQPMDQKKQLFINELTKHYQSHTNDRVNSLPLVGIRNTTPRSYTLSNIMVERFQMSALRVVVKVREMAFNMSPLKHEECKRQRIGSETSTNVCYKGLADLACIGADLQTLDDNTCTNSNNDVGDWFEYVLTNQNRLQLIFDRSNTSNVSQPYYPLVGLQERKSNFLNKFLDRITTPNVIETLRSFDLNQMCDNVLGVDARFNDALLSLAQETRHSFAVFAVRVLDRSLEILESAGCVRGVGVAKERVVKSERRGCDGVRDKDQKLEDQLNSWEFLAKEKICTVYRKLYKDTGLYQFKVIGRYHDITAKDFYDVQVDKEARKMWDVYATNLEVIDRDPHSGTEVVQWIMRYPFPMSSREYVFTRKGWISPENDTIVQVSRSVTHPAAPESSKSVRIGKYFSELVIKAHSSVEEPGFDFELTYFDDPRVYLPSSCVNWVTSTAMPDFLSKIHNAAFSRCHHPITGAAENVVM